MHDFINWTRREAAEVFDLQNPDDRVDLLTAYGGTDPQQFGRVLAHVDRNLRGRTAFVEYRYIDADYRSEHSRFYSTTFRRYPSIAHRIHFFRELLDAAAIEKGKPTAFDELDYLGYSVIRPVDANPVGRTMLRAHEPLEGHVSCRVWDEVDLFGSPLVVSAAPFMAQDSQLSVCIHVSAWVCAYYHHLRFGSPRRLAAEIAGFTPVDRDRLVPSAAVSVTQLVQMLNHLDLPPVTYDLTNMPTNESAESIACRYLDSGLPIIVGAGGHSFVLVGYRWVRQDGRRHVEFIRQDDLVGPYEIVRSIPTDKYTPWRHLVVPLPAKVYMSGEGAQRLGEAKIAEALRESSHDQSRVLHQQLGDGSRKLSYRASVHRSNEFKAAMGERAPSIAAAYQWLQLSRWVWVVELVCDDSWYRNEPSVVAEAIVDATGHAEDERVLAWRVPGAIGWTVTDFDEFDVVEIPDTEDVLQLQSLAVTDTAVVDV